MSLYAQPVERSVATTLMELHAKYGDPGYMDEFLWGGLMQEERALVRQYVSTDHLLARSHMLLAQAVGELTKEMRRAAV
jgi:hypothetical protein